MANSTKMLLGTDKKIDSYAATQEEYSFFMALLHLIFKRKREKSALSAFTII
jgi:hypothetical protein